MQLLAAAANVYKNWWSLVTYAASTIFPGTGKVYTPADLSAAAADISSREGNPLGFSGYTGLAQLYGIARKIEIAADTLTAAPNDAALDHTMVSEPPWSRDLNLQNAAPKWQLRMEVTYRAPDGSIITSWSTGIFSTVLPSTVGYLRQEATLQAIRFLSKRSDMHNTGGELLGIGRTYLMAI